MTALIQSFWFNWRTSLMCKLRGCRMTQINDSVFTYCTRCGVTEV